MEEKKKKDSISGGRNGVLRKFEIGEKGWMDANGIYPTKQFCNNQFVRNNITKHLLDQVVLNSFISFFKDSDIYYNFILF